MSASMAVAPMPSVGRGSIEPASLMRLGLDRAAERLERLGVPVPAREGKLLRPYLALAMVPETRWAGLDHRFWLGALAVQMAHEASLLHDDVIDGAEQRRGRPTLVAAKGVGAALVMGDHYLTGSYRAASLTASFEFLSRFAEAVERTVAGEIAQGRAVGRKLSTAEYDAAIEGKSGQLFGIAAALGGAVAGLGRCDERHEVGLAVGNLYQRIDDLLDYCTLAPTGKPALQDYRHRKWSWVLDLAGVDDFGLADDDVVAAVFSPAPTAPSAARRALEVLRTTHGRIVRKAAALDGSPRVLGRLLDDCVRAAEARVAEQEARLGSGGGARSPIRLVPPAVASAEDASDYVRARVEALGGPNRWRGYFGTHARTFSLAARLFPPVEAGHVTGLYAYCRFTDDLVDSPEDDPDMGTLYDRLDAWRELSLAAYDRGGSDLPLLDAVLGRAAQRGVSRSYPEALLDGVAMDLSPRRYHGWDDLERYTFGVAGAVGGWMAQLFGVRDDDLLERAHALGHAMQLTNISRDVGDDGRMGRLYLPLELLAAHGLGPDDIDAMIAGRRPLCDAYRDTLEAVMARADRYYEKAWPGIRALPPAVRRPVAAAASAYRGIHREIRRNGHDNLTLRAHSSTARKLVLAGAGLLQAEMTS